MADRQFTVVADDTPTAGKHTPTVLLLDSEGNPVDLADLVARVAALEAATP